LGDDAEAIILEVSEAVSTALDEFHFSMEALGDAIIFGEAPHGGERFSPGVESFCQGDQGGKGAGTKFVDDPEQSVDQGATCAFGLVFNIHEGTQGVHFLVDGLEGWMFGEELPEAQTIEVGEVVGAFAQSGEQASVVLDLRGDPAGQFHEVMEDEADDMEAIGDDFGVGEGAGDESPVRTGEIDTDHPHLVAALETSQIGTQIRFAAPRDDVEDAVVFEVGEGGRKAQALVEGVFINAEDGRALETETLGGLAPGELVVDARDGCGTDVFDPGH
jgi:hypothetical protein